MRPVAQKERRGKDAYRGREDLTEAEMDKLLSALKGNRHGHRDWLIGLVIYRHGLRVSEACGLRWDDIDLRKRTIIVRRLKGRKGRTYSSNERGQPFELASNIGADLCQGRTLVP